ncbi:MAG TPA: hypothetical protein VJ011_11445 [Steroidobacteraceae bacterium]|nr:hypothetical protein [Steroidobacteraceae bacterium]
MLGVAHVLGLLLVVFGGTYVIPIACSLIYRDGQLEAFVIAAAVSAAVGALIAVATRRHARELKPRDGFLLVTLAWALTSMSAAVPLMLTIPGLSFTDAFF